eukprot:Selendium_serpulae@DN6663_c0_g1_i1.p3
MATKQAGRCKWFDPKKGYGFISPEDGSPDVFMHQQNIHAEGFRTLSENELVEFEITIDQNGKRKAIQVTGPNGAAVEGSNRSSDGGFGGGGYGGGGGGRGGGGGGYGGGGYGGGGYGGPPGGGY